MKRLWISAVLAAGLALPAQAQDVADSVAPEMASGNSDKKMVTTEKFMVVAANPHASEAGFDVIKAGGNAIDAMVAVQLVLGLVEPQSSGIGGGAFLVYYDAQTGRMTTFDGRETAPASATPELFQNEDGEPLKFFDAVVGGRSVGTPGTVKLLYETHAKLGSMPWADLVAPAIKLATDGFEVSPRLAKVVNGDQKRLSRFETTRNYFFPDGKSLPVGHLLKNPEYAATLKAISEKGADAFYKGDIAKAIVKTVQNAEGNPGKLELADLANYKIKERPVVCAEYRSYEVCGMGPPSSGALTVGQILGQLNDYDLPSMNAGDPNAWRLIGDASRLAFADRGRYMADSDYVPMPTRGLIDPAYLKERGKLLSGDKALPKDKVVPGNPTWEHAMLLADDESIELPSTSHFSIVDANGNIVSMTTTIESGFGSRLMTNGFLLNNELTDFSFRTHRDGVPIANRVEPGKRPRSSMSPTIVKKDNKPVVVIGSPGGSRIIGYVATALIANLDWGMNIQEAVSMPHLINRFGTYDLEEGTAAEKLQPALEAMGYKTNTRALTSGLHGIVIADDGLQGGADPRREGLAVGE